MLGIKEKDRGSNPWIIRATNEDYQKIKVQYEQTEEERMLLVWNIMSGVRIIRADMKDGFSMHEDFSNISFPFDNLAGWWRAAMYMPVYNAIEEFIKK